MATKIQDSDRDILRYCHALRFATIDHLTALTGRVKQSLHARLLQLLKEKYLSRITFPNPNQKHIYTVGAAGYQYLAHHGEISLDKVPARLRANELKPLFLDHTLMISEIHATLLLASRTSHIQLADWQEGKDIYDSVNFYENGRQTRLPVCPDGFFTLKNTRRAEPGNRLSFALEADRSTMTHRTFNDKMRAYSQYLEQKKQEQFFGVKWFRVVTVTLTKARAENLAKLAADTLPSRLQKFFLFASREHFSLDSPMPIYASIFITPKSDETVSLIPE